MRWSDVCATYEQELRSGSGASVFSSDSENGNKHWADLKIRAVEHVCKLEITVSVNSVISLCLLKWHKKCSWCW